jgi:hypothetical protein
LNRKLLILDIALGVGVIYGGFELHSVWVAAKARQARMPGPPPKAAPVAAVPPLPQQPAVLPSGYQKIAVADLFDASRNPAIPIDAPPPPPPPPPPKDPPPLPSYHGMMDFGDPQGPIALITQHDGPGHQELHAGEMAGDFKLVSFNRQEMTLDWEGRIIHKRLNEGGNEKPKAQAPTAGIEPPAPGVIPGQAAQQAEQPKPQRNETGPGQDMTDTVKACQAGDTSPEGTVSGGYRKEIHMNPMGSQCIWRAVGK